MRLSLTFHNKQFDVNFLNQDIFNFFSFTYIFQQYELIFLKWLKRKKCLISLSLNIVVITR